MQTEAYVYLVRCTGGKLYAGWTTDPAARLHAHKTGTGAKYTRAAGAESLAYLERCPDKSAALRREAALKKLSKPQKEALCAAWSAHSRPRLSVASPADGPEIAALYNWYVQHSTATFQVTPADPESYRDWVAQASRTAPVVLARDEAGRLLAFACAHPWKEREAYAWDVETTVYCAPDARSTGAAGAVYGALLELVRRRGYWNAYAQIADPNPASERFHEKWGFACVGRTPHTAYKAGRWLGLSTWWLPLRRGAEAPAPLRALEPPEIADLLSQ